MKPKKPSLKGQKHYGYLGHFAQDKYIQQGHNDSGSMPIREPASNRDALEGGGGRGSGGERIVAPSAKEMLNAAKAEFRYRSPEDVSAAKEAAKIGDKMGRLREVQKGMKQGDGGWSSEKDFSARRYGQVREEIATLRNQQSKLINPRGESDYDRLNRYIQEDNKQQSIIRKLEKMSKKNK